MSRQIQGRSDARSLREALAAPPDYSEAFSGKVAALASAIGNALDAPVEHDADMNYSAAQRLAIWYDKRQQPVPPRDPRAKYQMVIHVSSRGPFCVVLTYELAELYGDRDGHGECWKVVAEDRASELLAKPRNQVTHILKSERYTPLAGAMLSQQVEGSATELDGRSATVFQVLFSEV